MLRVIENRLIYYPCRYPHGDWHPSDLAVEDVLFVTDDNVRLHGWYCPCPADVPAPVAEQPRPVLLYCHGNAGNLTIRAANIRAWQRNVGVDVFIFDYRGYGKSQGWPDEPGLYRDSRAAYHWLTGQRQTAPERIILFGRSLGGAVALELGLAAEHRCLILVSTFTSLPELAAELYPFLPVRWLLRTRYDNRERIRRYGRPVVICHGQDDSLVPCSHALELYRLAHEPKRLLVVPGADHNDLFYRGGPDFFAGLRAFVCESCAPAGPASGPSKGPP